MEKTQANPMDGRIRFYCTSHPTQVPSVTIHEQRWAYCPGGYVEAREDHAWVPIDPTSVPQLKPQEAYRNAVGSGKNPSA
jgi:hypothetical protein